MKCRTLIVGVLIVIAFIFMFSRLSEAQSEKPGNEKLVMIWSSADREVALNMVFMYTINSIRWGWWDDVTLVVWGPSAKLLAEDRELQEKIKFMIDDLKIVVLAPKLCSDNYAVSGKLEELGITVKYFREFTDYIKEGRNILTF